MWDCISFIMDKFNKKIWLRLRLLWLRLAEAETEISHLTPKLSVLQPSSSYKDFNKSFHLVPHQGSLDMSAYFEENIAQESFTQGVQDGINFSGMFNSANGNGFRNAVLESCDNELNYVGYS